MNVLNMNNGVSETVTRDELDLQYGEVLKAALEKSSLPSIHGLALDFHRDKNAEAGSAIWTLEDDHDGKVWLSAVQCWKLDTSKAAWEAAEKDFYALSYENAEEFDENMEMPAEPTATPWLALLYHPEIMEFENPQVLEEMNQLAAHLGYLIMDGH